MDFDVCIARLTGKDTNAHWDREGKFDALLNEFLFHVNDVKPVTARQCAAALPEIAEAKPELIRRIRAALQKN